MRRLGLLLVVAVAAGLLGARTIGAILMTDKPAALPTCSATTEGGFVRQAGEASGNPTKLCFCRSDGAGSPAYQWCKLEITGAEAVVCAGGSATVCP